MASRTRQFQIGDTIGDYSLTAFCGAGAFGRVFLAKNNIAGNIVALKILDSRQGQKEIDGLKEFQKCRHDHLIQIHHIGKVDDCFYYTMDMADNAASGKYEPDSLARRITKGKIPPDETFDLAVDLAKALDCLHDAGLIHRDIKPENIIYVNGEPVLADIGLVTQAERPDVSFAGTPRFVPKYVYAGGHPPCPESDFYALGMVLWCASTGQRDPEKAFNDNASMTLSGHSGDLQRLCYKLRDEQDYDTLSIRNGKDFIACLNGIAAPPRVDRIPRPSETSAEESGTEETTGNTYHEFHDDDQSSLHGVLKWGIPAALATIIPGGWLFKGLGAVAALVADDEENRDRSSGNDNQKTGKAKPKDYQTLLNKLCADNIFAAPNIPEDKLKNALRSFALDASPEDVLLLVDDSEERITQTVTINPGGLLPWRRKTLVTKRTVPGGNAEEGLVVTKDAVYGKKSGSPPKKIRLFNNTTVSVRNSNTLRFNNHEFITLSWQPKCQKIAAFIRAVCAARSEAFDSPNAPEILSQPRDSDDETGKAKPKDYQTLLNKLCEDNIFTAPDIPKDKLKNALRSFALDASPEDVLLLVDDTVWGSAKNGLIVTKDAVYGRELWSRPNKIRLFNNTVVSIRDAKTLYINNYKFITLTQLSKCQKLCAIIRAVCAAQTESFDKANRPEVLRKSKKGCVTAVIIFAVCWISLGIIGTWWEEKEKAGAANHADANIVSSASVPVDDKPEPTTEIGGVIKELVQHFPEHPQMKRIIRDVQRRQAYGRKLSDRDKFAELIGFYEQEKDKLIKKISAQSSVDNARDDLRQLAQALWERTRMMIFYLAAGKPDIRTGIRFDSSGYTKIVRYIYTTPIDDLKTPENENHPVLRAVFTLLARFAENVPAETEKIIGDHVEKWKGRLNMAPVADLEFIVFKKAHAVALREIRFFFYKYKDLKEFDEAAQLDYYEIGIALHHRNIALKKLQEKIDREGKK